MLEDVKVNRFVPQRSFRLKKLGGHDTRRHFLFLSLNLHAVLEQSIPPQKVCNNDVRSNAVILKSKLLFFTFLRLLCFNAEK